MPKFIFKHDVIRYNLKIFVIYHLKNGFEYKQ